MIMWLLLTVTIVRCSTEGAAVDPTPGCCCHANICDRIALTHSAIYQRVLRLLALLA